MPNPPEVAPVVALAASLLAGDDDLDSIVARVTQTLGQEWPWLRPLAQRYVQAFSGKTRPRACDVVEFLDNDRSLRRAWAYHKSKIAVASWMNAPQRMQPVPAAARWDLPPIESVPALAEWLGVTQDELDWFADLKTLTAKRVRQQLRHYHYTVLTKPGGGIRLIEAPKSRLKAMQRKILAEILDRVPPHPAAHGFVPGRSIKTFVAPHVGKRVVLKMDLQNFFPSIHRARIQTIFRTLGYPEPVADVLGGLCTTPTPRAIWKDHASKTDADSLFQTRAFYARPHLPQGAPTSPALANICAFRFDARLRGLAESATATYTRYADDLAFSGATTFAKHVEKFSTHVAAIVLEEGFAVQHRKTRIMRQAVRQKLVGLTVNQRPNITRTDFDRLKAILTNCIRHGAASQNRTAHPDFRAHLAGRIAFVEFLNPQKAQRLRQLMEQVSWV